MEEKSNKIKKILLLVFTSKIFIITMLALIIVIFFASANYIIQLRDTTEEPDNQQNAPGRINQYTNNVTVSEDGSINLSMTPQEFWDQLVREGNRVTNYLSSAQELARIMYVQTATEMLYTGDDPEHATLDSHSFDVNSRNVQGIVKLRRANPNGDTSNTIYMRYKSPSEFQSLVSSNNDDALNYFTLETRTTQIGSNNTSGGTTNANSGSTVSTDAGNRIIQEARKYVGVTPYVSGGKDLETGVDCSGFVYAILKKLDLYDGEYQNDEGIRENIGENIGTNIDDAQPGDIICYDGHVAFAKGGRSGVIHAKNERDGVVETDEDPSTFLGSSRPILAIKRVVSSSGVSGNGNRNISSIDSSDSKYITLLASTNPISSIKIADNSDSDDTTGLGGHTSGIVSNTSHWPTPSCTTITQYFNSGHGAIDIGAHMGDNVEAVEAGIVINTATGKVRLYENPGTLETNGNYVAIDHGNGKITLYNHLNDVAVSVGDTVAKGQLIGHVGNTGYTVGETGEHLHFAIFNGSGSINYQGSRDDPLQYKYDNGMGNGSGPIGTNVQATLNPRVTTTETGTNPVTRTSFVAKIAVKNTDGTMRIEEVDYKPYLNNYSMPFNYIWSWLVISGDKDFAFDMADLVYGSNFEITIHDNLTQTTTNITQYSQAIDPRTGNLIGRRSVTHSTETENEYTYETALTTADAWTAKYNQEYNYTVSSEQLPSEEHSYMGIGENEKIDRITQKTVTKYKFEADEVAKPEEKMDKNDEEPNFVKLLSNSKNAKTNLNTDMLIEVLERNEDTKDMVDLTKYILNKTKETRYEVGDFNTVWSRVNNTLSSTGNYGGTSGIGGNAGTIYDFLLSKGITPVGAAAILGNLSAESGDDLNSAVLEEGARTRSGYSSERFTQEVNNGTISRDEFVTSDRFWARTDYGRGQYGYGLAQWTYPSRKEKLYDFAKSYSENFDIGNLNIQLEYLWKELEGYTSLKNYLMTVEGEDNISDAAKKWNREFERSEDTSDTRQNNATKWYNEWKNNHLTNEHGFIFYQDDYGDYNYGEGTIASWGCGPTSFAMVVSDLTGKRITPVDIINWCGNTYAINGTTFAFFPAAAEQYGLQYSETWSIDEVVSALKAGKKVISSQGPGRFTDGGHYITLYSYDEETQKIYVKSPSKYRTNGNGYYTKEEVDQYKNHSYLIFSR